MTQFEYAVIEDGGKASGKADEGDEKDQPAEDPEVEAEEEAEGTDDDPEVEAEGTVDQEDEESEVPEDQEDDTKAEAQDDVLEFEFRNMKICDGVVIIEITRFGILSFLT